MIARQMVKTRTEKKKTQGQVNNNAARQTWQATVNIDRTRDRDNVAESHIQ